MAVMQRRHEAMLGVERDLVGAREAACEGAGVEAGLDAEASSAPSIGSPSTIQALAGLAQLGIVAEERGAAASRSVGSSAGSTAAALDARSRRAARSRRR